jgi:hypothetical protein
LTFPLAAHAFIPPSVTISPGYSTIAASTTLQYSATVSGLSNTAVVWEVNGIVGGNSTYGTISSTGLYKAPSIVPPGSILIQALASNKTTAAAVYVVLAPNGPSITSVSPAPIPLGTYTITVHGTGFQPGATVRNNIGNLPTIYVNSTTLTAIGYAGTSGTSSLQAMNPGSLWGSIFSVYYGSPLVVSPASASLMLGATRQFTSPGATSWSASAGTISATGLYTAPATMPASGTTVTVTANGPPGPTNATVTLIAPTGAVLPAAPTVLLGGTQQFSATGATAWTASVGTITSAGLYTAPAKLPSTGSSVTITATGPGGSSTTTATLSTATPIVVSPATATVTLGKTQQFTATGAAAWTASAGTITGTGLYTAPSTMPASSAVTITVVNAAGSTGTASVTLVKPTAVMAITPATASIQVGTSLQFTAPGTNVWSVTSGAGVVSDTGYYTAPNTMPANPSVTLMAVGAGGTGTATITLIAGAPQTVSPATVAVSLGTTQQFTSTGATSWSATAGTISSTGTYTAPATMPAISSVTISATGPNGTGTALVTLINGAVQSISPTTVSVTVGTTQQFTSVGATSWTATVGSVTSTGLYTAPATLPANPSASVTASGPNGTATAAVTLTAPTAQTISPALATVVLGNTLQFTSPGASKWTAVLGTISSTGLYTAPSGTLLGVDTVTATGPLNSATALVTLVAIPSSGAVSITTDNPLYGWQVIPGATRRIHARVTNGSSNQVTWSYTTAGGATATLTPAPAPNVLGAFVDVTVGSTGSTCTNVGTATNPVFSSASAVSLVATSVDDPTKSATVLINVCNPPVSAYVSPFNVRLYSGQTVDLQSWVWGAVNDNVTWSVTQPSGGNGTFIAPPSGGSATTARDAVFSATVAGNYTVTATSVANPSVSASATISVSGNPLPSYAVTPNHTEPVDCSVDPTLNGKTFDVGAGHPYLTLAQAFVANGSDTISPGTTIRLFNTDTTGTNPTHYHEYLRIDGQGTQTQPIRVVGCADSLGNLPVMDAANATSYSPTDNSVAANIAGLYQIALHHSNGFAVYPTITSPSYVIIEGLAFRNAYPTTGSTSNYYYNPGSSTATQWGQAASCIRPYEGNHVTIRGNDMEDCSFGVLGDFNGNNGWGGFFGDFDLQGNYFTNIGAVNQSEHMAYVQGFRQVIQGNVFDQLKPVSAAGELKMRGVGEIVRYNLFNSSTNTRTIDFVEEQDSNMYMSFLGYYYTPSGSMSFHNEYPTDGYTPDLIAAGDEAWHKAYAYGNVINLGPATPNSQAPIHFFGDQGQYVDVNTNPPVRVGDLFDYNNTIYSVGGNTLHFVDTMQNQDNQFRWEWPTLNLWNNAMYVGPINTVGNQLFQMSTLRSDIFNLGPNWLSTNWGTNNLNCSNNTGNICFGTGWPYQMETTQYMDGGNLPAHVSGLSNLITGGGTIPFNTTTWVPTSGGGLVGAGAPLPSNMSNMPVRFQINAPTYSVTPRKNPLTLGAHD